MAAKPVITPKEDSCVTVNPSTSLSRLPSLPRGDGYRETRRKQETPCVILLHFLSTEKPWN